MAGVAIVDPAEVRPSRKPPPVALEGMRIDGLPMQEVDWLAAQAPGAPPIVIRPEQKSFDITYTGLSFINSEALQFRYRLVGADPNWIEAGTRRTAYFSHLPPGDYVFEVLAATADGVWAETGPALRLRIEAQFWRRPSFWVAVALAVTAMVGVLLLLRESRHRRRVAAEARAQHAFARQLIASQEGERKRIAAELHDSLGQNLLVMLNRAQLGLLSAEPGTPAREQLASIQSAARDALEEVRTISHNLRPHHLDRLGLTQTIEVMLQRIADSGAIEVVNEMVPVDDRVSAEDAITVYRVLQECLNNVLKHSRASEVRVGCERDVDSVLFWITDNGVGFDYTATVARAGGFGLVGMAERVQMLGGRWSVESTPGAGTTVSVRLQAVQGIEPEPPGE
jgi:signal transduction histidine kinase